MFALIVICLMMIPIYMGWVLMFGWPFVIGGYLAVAYFMKFFSTRNAIKVFASTARRKVIWGELKGRTKIPWPAISSSLELSCRTRDVAAWMTKMGVVEVEGLRDGSDFSSSTAFPNCYDLVTNFLDIKNSRSLDHQYKSASGFLRTGGIFVDCETELKLHSLQEHIDSAKKFGLGLIERSDLESDSRTQVSQNVWTQLTTDGASALMVWCKV
ncbi:MAG: hypothetical protein IPM97_16085 [Bdellovibrionaceae bacterium]|nr:hypothetical protein [Pseudobdellovibrionaceae bacterium]